MRVNKSHLFCHCPFGFRMSPYLQDLVAFIGQNHVYEDASEQLAKSNIAITAKQVERVTNAYGLLIEAESSQIQEDRLKEKYPLEEKATKYCMLDGSMLLTQEDDWKETKLCRLFSQND